MPHSTFLLALLTLVSSHVFGQSTYEQVRDIVTTKCSATCHGDNAYSFNVTDPASVLYDSLLNASPKNTYALASNFKLISPGYPDRSYLLRKVGNCLSADLALHADEGSAMPKGETPLLYEDIELIRQWILFGAPDTGTVIDKALIDDYYQNSTLVKIERPTPPKSCEGFQIHMGPIFYAPGEEAEYYQRYDLNLSDTIEVIGTYSVFNTESHHFIVTKYINNTAQYWPQGLVKESDDAMFGGDKEFLMACLNGDTYQLPNGTAFYWDQNESLDLDYHLFNTNTEVLAAEVYLNVYTQPKGMASRELQSDLAHNYGIVIPNSAQPETTLYYLPTGSKSISNITSHTHKTGVNFDVYLRNTDGTKGLQVFDGSYNYLQGFDTGAYDWSHPPIAFFEPFLDMSQPINNGSVPAGLIMEATYLNTGNDTLAFGITTEDEMMAIFYQFVDSSYVIPANRPYVPTCIETYVDPCKDTMIGIQNVIANEINSSVYPNPTTNTSTIEYALVGTSNFVQVDVVNLLGEVVNTVLPQTVQPAGDYQYSFNLDNHSEGIYLLRLSVNGENFLTRLILSGN